MDKLKTAEIGKTAAFRTKAAALDVGRAFLKKFRLQLPAAV